MMWLKGNFRQRTEAKAETRQVKIRLAVRMGCGKGKNEKQL